MRHPYLSVFLLTHAMFPTPKQLCRFKFYVYAKHNCYNATVKYGLICFYRIIINAYIK